MTERSDDNTTPETQKARPVIAFDYELYEHYLADTDLSEDQKREFLETMWNLIVEFMSLGFEIHPVQQAQNACGKLSESRSKPPISGGSGVQSKGKFPGTDFSDAAKGSAPEAAERIRK